MVLPFRRKNPASDGNQVPDDSELLEIVDQIEEEFGSEQNLTESDNDSINFEEKLLASAKTVTRTCMDIRRNENVLIICDPTTSEIGAALHQAALSLSDRVLLMMMPKGKHHGDEPPTPVSNLMRQQNVIIAPTKYSITHTKAARNALNERARIATMPGINNSLFTEGGITANFEKIKAEIAEKAVALRRKRFISVRHPNGTDLSFEVGWRDWNQDDNGICNRPKMITNLPAGKIFVMPKEGTMNGTLVIDGSWDSNLLSENLVLQIENGLVMDISGGGQDLAVRIKSDFSKHALKLPKKDQDLVWTMAEFGIGLNPMSKLVGNALEDEKCYASCYFSMGDNSAFGGNANVGINMVGVMKTANIYVDEKPFLVDGEFRD